MAKLTVNDRMDILSSAVKSVGPIESGLYSTHTDEVVNAAKKFEAFIIGETNPRIVQSELEEIQVEYEHFRQLVLSGDVPVDENGEKLMNWLDKLLGA